MTSIPTTLSALREHIAIKDETIRQLQAVLAPTAHHLRGKYWPIADFSNSEVVILDTLMRAEIASFDRLYAALYSGRYGSDAPGRSAPDNGTIKVLILRIRRKLAPHGIEVFSVYGRGYRIPPEHKSTLRSLIDRAATPKEDV